MARSLGLTPPAVGRLEGAEGSVGPWRRAGAPGGAEGSADPGWRRAGAPGGAEGSADPGGGLGRLEGVSGRRAGAPGGCVRSLGPGRGWLLCCGRG